MNRIITCSLSSTTTTYDKNYKKYIILQKVLHEKTAYMEKNCVLNNSKHCKQKWYEIKTLNTLCMKLRNK